MNHREPTASQRSTAESPFAWAQTEGLGSEIARLARAEARRRTRRRWVVAAATTSVLALGLLFWSRQTLEEAPLAAGARGRTKVVSPERRVLPDGSVVDLKGGAELRAIFSPVDRRVELSRGEAHFEVAKDPARPFVVRAHGVEVRAVGTAFTVARGNAEVEVLVVEGRVAVSRAQSSRPPAQPEHEVASVGPKVAELSAGSRTLVPAAEASGMPAVVPVSAEELAQRLAWRVPRLEFDATPLGEVARLFAEYGRVRLVLADAALNQVRVSGILRADNSEALLQLLAADHGIEGVRRGSEIVLDRPRR